ncbi:MAG: hypothetical protein HY921_08070 [Elusimicrobia bacterium]|nr:hypothetical protein [Elusimicrobiota bacterium]
MAAIRIAGILLVLALKAGCPPLLYRSLFFAALFPHYVLAAVYSRGRIRALWSSRAARERLALLGAAGASMMAASIPSVIVIFGAHHAFTEAYLSPEGSARHGRLLTAARISLSFAAYGTLLWGSDPFFRLMPERAWQGAVLLCSAWLLAAAWRSLPALGKPQFGNLLVFEGTGVLAALVLAGGSVQFLDVVFYHLCVWIILPVLDLRAAGARPALLFLGQAAAATAAFFLAMPYAGLLTRWGLLEWRRQGELWAYAHIASSLALSRRNPGWIRRLFQPNGT